MVFLAREQCELLFLYDRHFAMMRYVTNDFEKLRKKLVIIHPKKRVEKIFSI
jgi:hypothetical protein